MLPEAFAQFNCARIICFPLAGLAQQPAAGSQLALQVGAAARSKLYSPLP